MMVRARRLSAWIIFLIATLNTCAGLVAEPLIADHSAVEKYENIPAEWIAEVKKMWLNVPGESHSSGYRIGTELLENLDQRFQVNRTDSGTPEAYTDQHLRISGTTWGNVNRATLWSYGYGEADWYTSPLAIERTKAHITYSNTNNLAIAAIGFGWCWDTTWHNSAGGDIDPAYQVRWAGSSVGGPEGDLRWGLDAGDQALTGNSVSMDTYLTATQQLVDHCRNNNYPTKVLFTTGPVDGGGNTGERGYQRYLKHQHIREYIQAHDGILFDYADILTWSDSGTQNTVSWRDHGGNTQVFPYIHSDNMLDMGGTYAEDGDHIGQRGALRLAKAMWWLLARIAGWDGGTGESDTTPPVLSHIEPINITDNSALISWVSNEQADSQVEYGPTQSYGSSTILDTNLQTSHSMELADLISNALYHYRVKSSDASGNLAVSADYVFTTFDQGQVSEQFTISDVVASSDDGNIPENTIDNYLATRWSAEGDGEWIEYDLEAENRITQVRIAFHRGDQRTTQFDIQVSIDRTSWATVFSGTSSGSTLQQEEFNIQESSARYVRIVGHGNSVNNWNSITEVDIYGFDGAGKLTPPTNFKIIP